MKIVINSGKNMIDKYASVISKWGEVVAFRF
jgi:hypothetical protein